MRTVKNILFALIMGLLFIPLVQKSSDIIRSKDLYGYFVPKKKPDLTLKSWFSGKYQDSATAYYNENPPLRSDLVRLYNQVDYSLFSIPHAEKIVRGKKGYLFSEEYIHAWLGEKFAGRTNCNYKVYQLQNLQEFLWKEKGILLLVVFTPDKATFFPEYIPDRFLKKEKDTSNYSYYSERCAEKNINTIDFNRMFLKAKDTSRYPLYPKTGIHWSTYGAVLAGDSLAKYIKSKLNRPVPQMKIDRLEISKEARDLDADIEETMNLIFPIPHPDYAYPQFHFTETGTQKPMALFVGDSFYWEWYNLGIIRNLFGNEDFWFYNSDVFPRTALQPLTVSGIDVKRAIERQNVIVLMQVNGAYGNPGYGFIDKAAEVLDLKGYMLNKAKDMIRTNPEWMNSEIKKASDAHVSLEKQIEWDAHWLLDQEMIKNVHQ
jgi:hypothetical protein